MANAPAMPPTNCATRYPGTSGQGNLRAAASARVTAGLMWQPEMCPIAYTIAMITIMKANEMMPSWAMENWTPVDLAIMKVAAAVPGPQITSAAVPMNSAASFWAKVTSDMRPPPWARLRSAQPNGVSQEF